MTNPMKIRAKADGAVVEVKVLMSHRMETGLRKSDAGDVIPAHYIQLVTVGPRRISESFFGFQVQGWREGWNHQGHVDGQSRRVAHGRGDHQLARNSRET